MNGTDLMTLTSRTTAQGQRLHNVKATNGEFARALYTEALSLGTEPCRVCQGRNDFEVEFVCEDSQCSTVIEAARTAKSETTTSDTTNSTQEEGEAQGDTLPPDFLKREWARPVTLSLIRDRFREWLSSEHVSTQDELRDKREDFRLAAPIVEALRHMERAAQMVGEHEALGAQIEALETRYNALEACQLVSAGIYEVDFADEHTARFFAEFIAGTDVEKWCLW